MLPIIYSDQFLQHKTGYGHPEKPERLTAIKTALESAPWGNQLDWRQPTPVAQRPVLQEIARVHAQTYIEQVQQLSQQGGGYLDLDTPISAKTYEVALLAVSAWRDGVDYTLSTGTPCFVLARPPGHHALPNQGMGFCIFSNAAIAAYYALAQPQVQRVAILDWDVHHGNGTQAIVEGDARIAYCSLHQFPCYPGTGRATEQGAFENVLNIPLLPDSSLAEYQPAFEQQVMPFLNQFQPDLLLVSAGYDANADDPLANMILQPEDFGVFTQYCLQLTHRIVFGLEGGYDFHALAKSVVATIECCLKGS
jgi:acetoin utilization deacetylase AcuC-like enzyme